MREEGKNKIPYFKRGGEIPRPSGVNVRRSDGKSSLLHAGLHQQGGGGDLLEAARKRRKACRVTGAAKGGNRWTAAA